MQPIFCYHNAQLCTPLFCVPNFKAIGYDNVFTFFGNFHALTKRRKKTKKFSQLLKVHISKTPGIICLKFGIWGCDVGWHFQYKNHLVLSQSITKLLSYMWKLHYCVLPVNNSWVVHWLLGPHDTLPCVLMWPDLQKGIFWTHLIYELWQVIS